MYNDVNGIPRFSDYVKAKPLDGEKIRIDEVVDKPIVVIGYRLRKSRFNDGGSPNYLTIQFYFEDDPHQEHFVVFTGSGVIIDQIKEMDKFLNQRPGENHFATVIKKIGNYTSLT